MQDFHRIIPYEEIPVWRDLSNWKPAFLKTDSTRTAGNQQILQMVLRVYYYLPRMEMAPWDKTFTQALNELADQWNKAILDIIEKGKKNGYIKKETNAKHVTMFIISGYWAFAILESWKIVKSLICLT